MTALGRFGLGAALVLAVSLLVWAGPPPTGAAEDRERLLAYPVDSELRFALEPGSEAVKLVSWLILAGDDADITDARRTHTYALELSLFDAAGALVESHPLWLRTRATRDRSEQGAEARTWVESDPDRVVSEDRITHLTVGSKLPDGGTLRIAPGTLPPGARLALVAFGRQDRTPVQALRAERSPEDAPTRDALAARLGIGRWDALPESWRAQVTRHRWERLGALPLASGGGSPDTLALQVWFLDLDHDEAVPDRVFVPAGGAVAWNVGSGADLSVQWFTPAGREVFPPVDVRRVESLVPDPRLAGRHWVSEQWALSNAAEGPLVVRARLGPDAGLLGDPARHPQGATTVVAPDFRSVELTRVPVGERLRYPIAAGEVGRVSVWRAVPGPRPAFADVPEVPTAVTVRALDASGAELGSWTTGLGLVPSAFERYVEGDSSATTVAGPAEVDVVPPVGTRWLELGGDATVDLGLRVAAPPLAGRLPARGYELPDDPAVHLRFAPARSDGYEQRDPEDREALAVAGRLVRLDEQVRLEPASVGDGSGGAPPAPRREPLVVQGPFELLVDPDRDGVPGAAARTRLGESPETVVADTRLVITYRVPEELVGTDVRAVVDGELRVLRATQTTGDWRLPVASGAHQVSVEAPGWFFTPALGRSLWNERRVNRVPSTGLEVALPPGPCSVAVETWAPVGAPVRLRLGFTGDPAPGLYTERTSEVALREAVPLPGLAQPWSFAGGPLVAHRSLVVERRADRQDAALVLASEGDGPVWARLLASCARPAPRADVHARTRGP